MKKETQMEKEARMIDYGRALDCPERLSDGQLDQLKHAIESEQKERKEEPLTREKNHLGSCVLK
jgi:hypothetical protein